MAAFNQTILLLFSFNHMEWFYDLLLCSKVICKQSLVYRLEYSIHTLFSKMFLHLIKSFYSRRMALVLPLNPVNSFYDLVLRSKVISKQSFLHRKHYFFSYRLYGCQIPKNRKKRTVRSHPSFVYFLKYSISKPFSETMH